MSIVFDQVDGVVQKDGDPAAQPSAAPAAPAAPQRPAAEQFEETHHRMEWLTRRLAAD
jgi:hypothetical protein